MWRALGGEDRATAVSDEGISLFNAERWIPAAKKLLEAAAAFERDGLPVGNVGGSYGLAAMAYENSGRYVLAERYYTKAISLLQTTRPDDDECLFVIRLHKLLRKLDSDKISFLGYAVPDLHPDELQDERCSSLFQAALAYRSLGDHERALAVLGELQRCVGDKPSSLLAKTHAQLGAVKLALGQPVEAVELHRQAVALSERTPHVVPLDHSALWADLALAVKEAAQPDLEAVLERTGQACDRAGDHGHGVWAWTQLADLRLAAEADTPEIMTAQATSALGALERARLHAQSPAYAEEDPCAFPNILKREAEALGKAGDRAAALARAIEACEQAAVSCPACRARCAIYAASGLVAEGRSEDAGSHVATALVALSEARETGCLDSEDLAWLSREARLVQVRVLSDSDAAPARERARRLQARLIAQATRTGDHLFAGRARNALDHRDGNRASDDATQLDRERPFSWRGGQFLRVATEEEAARAHIAASEDEPAAMYLEFTDDALRYMRRAEAFLDSGDLPQGVSSYEQALACQVNPDGRVAQRFVGGACELILKLSYLRLGQGDRAEVLLPLIHRGLELVENDWQRFELLRNRARAQSHAGNLPGAIDSYTAAFVALPSHAAAERAGVLTYVAEAHLRLGAHERAVEVLDEASGLAPGDTQVQASILHTRARAEHGLQRHHRAAALLREALALLDTDTSSPEQFRAMLLVDLGHALTYDDPRAAIPAYQEAITIITKIDDRFHLVPALEGLVLARAHAGQLDNHEAQGELERLLALRRENGDREGEIATLSNLAWHLVATGSVHAARQKYDAAIAIARELRSPGLLTDALIARANVDDAATRNPHVEKLLEEACRLLEQERATLTAVDDRADYLAQRTSAFALLAAQRLAADPPDLDGVLDATERVRALGIGDLLTAQDLRDAAPEPLRADEEAAFTELEQAWLAAGNGSTTQDHSSTAELRVHAAEQRLRAAQGRIRSSVPALISAERLPRATRESLRRGPLADGSALVIYTIVNHRYIIAHCMTDGGDSTFGLDPAITVEQQAHEFAAGLANGLPRPLHAHNLYRALLQPIADEIAGRPLILVPDGVLHQIPFAALLTEPIDQYDAVLEQAWEKRAFGRLGPDDPVRLRDLERDLQSVPMAARRLPDSRISWLLRKHSIRVIPSASVLLDLHRNPRRVTAPDAQFVGLGDSTPPADDATVTEEVFRVAQSTTLRPLPWAREEVRGIVHVLGNGLDVPDHADSFSHQGLHLRLGRQATRSEFEAATAGGARWLHLACHAIVDPPRPWASRVLLAGAQHASPHLTAATILRRRLACQLVVLSCCNTGLGRLLPGEGVLGLPRAFLAAGAQAVCGTLWPVLDEAGPPLMLDLYQRLASGEAPWDALRAAQLTQGDRGAAASQWAGYTIIG